MLKPTPHRTHVKLSASCSVGPYVELGIASGRRSAPDRPLVIGNHAIIRSGSALYRGTRIGTHFETGHHVIIREECALGNHVSIWNNTTIDYGCRIGHRVKIHCNCYVAQFSTLEEDVFLAPGVTFANDLFPGSRYAARVLQGPLLKRGAQVGVQCTLLPGVVLGRHCLIGAGSVVTRSIPDGVVAWGNPAVVRKSIQALRWPERMELLQGEKARFYRRRLASRPVFKPI